MARVIKRYSNRKLYDQQASRYVTLDEVRQLIRDGAEIRVEDATSGDDLTSVTLTQILLENERSHQVPLPAVLLHQLIRHGEAWYDFLDRTLRTSAPDHWSGTPLEVARFWTDWTARAGGGTPDTPQQPSAPPAREKLEEELSALKEKLLALEQRVDGRKKAPGRTRSTPRTTRRRR